MSYPIIHHNGAFNLWSTEWDRPVFPEAKTRAELLAYIRATYGSRGLSLWKPGLARAQAKGTSLMRCSSLEALVENNRAGKDECCIRVGTLISQFLTLRPPLTDRMYTITCVCGVSVRTRSAVRLKDPSAIEHEGSASVRVCPACHPTLFRLLPNWWVKREPGDIPASTQAHWEAEDEKRRARMKAAVDRGATRSRLKKKKD